MTLRVGISYPRIWYKLESQNSTKTNLAKQWLSVKLNALSMKENIIAITGLRLGLDMYFANLCYTKGISYTIVAANNQDIFWDNENRKTFKYLIERGDLHPNTNSKDIYKEGYYSIQQKLMDEWLLEEKSSLLVFKYLKLSQEQQNRISSLKNKSEITIYYL